MLKFFDYIFYRVSAAYYKKGSSTPEITGICTVSIIQYFGIFDFFLLLEIIKREKLVTNKLILVIPAIFFMVFNYIRYIYLDDHSYLVLKKMWENESKKRERSTMVLLVIVFSLILFFGLAIYTGSNRW